MKTIEAYTAKKNGTMMLNANELYRNVSDVIVKELQEAIAAIPFHRYPDETSEELIQAYADVMKLSAQQILAGNGSDEMLGLMIGYFLGKDKKLFTLAPDFSMYDYYASMHESEVLKFPCEKDGSFSVTDFIAYGKAEKIHMVLFSNPNNPTGHTLSNNDLCKIVDAFPDIPVIIDEAYAEFAPDTMLTYIEQYQNLYVTRTLSKAYGLAGARLGFLISSKANISALRPYIVPYNISSITQKIGTIVLSHASDYTPFVAAIIEERERLYNVYKGLKTITFYPSNANYLYGRSTRKEAFISYLEKQGIIIRSYKDDSFRITIGSKEENDIVQQCIFAFEMEV